MMKIINKKISSSKTTFLTFKILFSSFLFLNFFVIFTMAKNTKEEDNILNNLLEDEYLRKLIDAVYPEYLFKPSIVDDDDPVESNILRWQKQQPIINNKRSNQPNKRLFLARIGKRGMMPIYRARVG